MKVLERGSASEHGPRPAACCSWAWDEWDGISNPPVYISYWQSLQQLGHFDLFNHSSLDKQKCLRALFRASPTQSTRRYPIPPRWRRCEITVIGSAPPPIILPVRPSSGDPHGPVSLLVGCVKAGEWRSVYQPPKLEQQRRNQHPSCWEPPSAATVQKWRVLTWGGGVLQHLGSTNRAATKSPAS